MCEHRSFITDAKIARLIDSEHIDKVTGYRCDLTIHCSECMMPFLFIGLPYGYKPDYPTVSIERDEIRIPIEPVIV